MRKEARKQGGKREHGRMQKRIRRRVWREMDVNEGERLRGEEEGSKKKWD